MYHTFEGGISYEFLPGRGWVKVYHWSVSRIGAVPEPPGPAPGEEALVKCVALPPTVEKTGDGEDLFSVRGTYVWELPEGFFFEPDLQAAG